MSVRLAGGGVPGSWVVRATWECGGGLGWRGKAPGGKGRAPGGQEAVFRREGRGPCGQPAPPALLLEAVSARAGLARAGEMGLTGQFLQRNRLGSSPEFLRYRH